MEPAERPVVLRHLAFTLEYMDLDRRLALGCRREDLAFPRGDRRVRLDQPRHHPAQRLDAERQRGHVEKKDVRHISRKHAPLDRRADRHHLVRVHTFVRLPAEDILHELLHARNARHAADEYHLVDLRRGESRILQCPLGRPERLLDKIVHKLFELRPRQRHVQVLRTVRRRGDERQVDLRLHERGELHLGLLGRFADPLQGHRVLPDIDPFRFLEFIGDKIEHPLVKIVPPEVRVAVCRFHFEHSVAELEDRDIERPAAEIVNGDLEVFVFLVESVRERGGGRLIDDALDLESCDFPRLFRCLPLGIIEIRRHGYDRLGDLLPEVVLRGLLHLLQDHRADLGRRIDPVPHLHARRIIVPLDHFVRDELHLLVHLIIEPSHEPLDRGYGVLGVRDRLTLCRLTHEALSVLGKCHDRWGRSPPLAVRDHDRITPLHDRNN